MGRYTNGLSAEGLIKYIANDYVELSVDKAVFLYHEHMEMCKEWLVHNTDPMSPEEKQDEMNNNF